MWTGYLVVIILAMCSGTNMYAVTGRIHSANDSNARDQDRINTSTACVDRFSDYEHLYLNNMPYYCIV